MTTLRPITLSAPVAIQAAAGESPRRFKVEPAYSGGKLLLVGYSLPVVIDLAGLTPRGNVTANLDHKQDARVGHVDSVGNNGKTLTLAGIVSAASTAAAEFVASAERGYPWAASVEVQPAKLEEIAAGASVQVNGQTFQGPLYVTRKGTLYGIAFLPQGADENARAVLASRRQKPMAQFLDWAKNTGIDVDQRDAEQLATLHANFNGRSDVTDDDRTAVAPLILASGEDDEHYRLRKIDSLCTPPPSGWPDHVAPRVTQLQASAIAGDVDIQTLKTEMRKMRADAFMESIPLAHTVPASRRHGIGDEKTLTAAFCLLGGIAKPEQHFDERTLDAADRASRGLGLQSFLMTAACQNGYQARPGEYITAGNLRNVLTAAFMPQIQASGWSTADISNVLSNTASKMLLDGFQEMPSEWRSIAAVKDVRNFKQHTFVRLLDSLEFEQLGEAAQIKHGTLGDDTLTGQAYTYAKMLTLTRESIINDDLGALTDIPRRLGRAAAQKFNSIFWTAFTASDSFWGSGNGNVLGTGDERLSTAGLTNGLSAFRAQTSPAADGSKLIGGKPAILLVPPALEITARALLNSSNIIDGTATATQPGGNPFQGLCTLVVEDRLSTAQGGNDAYWYLLRAPTFAPAMLVPALNGRVEPTVETAEADFSQLGISMRGYSDVGAARGEPLCGLLLDGTSS